MVKQTILFVFIAIFIGLSQTAGVGGGPITNISLMMGLGYNAKLSISITYIFLIGGSIASIWKNTKKQNIHNSKSYINIDLILLTLPIMSSGTLFGVIFSVIKNFLSQLIITLLFVFLFLFIIYDLKKSIHKLQQANDVSLITIKSINNKKRLGQKLIQKNQQIICQNINNNSKVKQVIVLCIGYYIFTVVLSLMRGGHYYQSMIGINHCGLVGWLLLFIHLGVSIYWSLRIAKKLTSGDYHQDVNEKKVQIHQENVWKYIVGGFVAGVVGATLAIGGALILIPVWFKVGVDRDVSASTTPPLILTAALVAFTIALFNGYYQNTPTLQLLFYLVLSFISAALVKDFITYITIKYQLKSFVIQLFMGIVIVSLCIMLPYQLSKMAHDFGKFVEFGTFC